MKKLLFVLGIVVIGLTFFTIRSDAGQQVSDENQQVIRTLVMQSSWNPGSFVQEPSFVSGGDILQFGRVIEVQSSGEVVSAQSANCLMCHYLSYAELSKHTVDYRDRWGEKVNPHIYVDEARSNPHHERSIVPDCLRCHREHSDPWPTDAERLIKPRLDYCYSCHHEQTFEACSDCH